MSMLYQIKRQLTAWLGHMLKMILKPFRKLFYLLKDY